MISRMTSLAYTPRPSRPVTRIRRTFSGSIARHCDASTSRTCDVPMPNATAPNAPWVDVWLSPHAIVMPGCVSPSSGPMTWTMPCAPLDRSKQPDACLAAVPLERRQHVLGHHVEERPPLVARGDDVVDRRDRPVRDSAPSSPRARSMSNACGVVTSWIRCRPMNSCVCPFGSLRTVCASQTF